MDRISRLSDDLLLNICSLLPMKDVVATTLLSERWKFLWTKVPRLVFDDNFVFNYSKDEDYDGNNDSNGYGSKYGRFRQFVDRVMVLHNAPVLQTLKFDVGPWCNSEDMAHWLRIGIIRHVRELEISHSLRYWENHESIRLPTSLYMYAKLEVLKLTNTIVLDVPPTVCLPSLKSLHLLSVEFKTKNSHRELFSACPVLGELVVEIHENDSFPPYFYVAIPSLVRLTILNTWKDRDYDVVKKLVLNVPSLKYLKIDDTYNHGLLCLSENMPEVVEADVKVSYKNPEKLMGSLTSVKRLSLSLTPSMVKLNFGFYKLGHLELGVAPEGWDLFTYMLENCPKLQVLKLYKNHECYSSRMHIKGRWGVPSSVPECLLLHLNTFEWMYYNGRREGKKLVAYILKNARQLKIAALSACDFVPVEESEKLQKLVCLPRGSSSCQLLLGLKKL